MSFDMLQAAVAARRAWRESEHDDMGLSMAATQAEEDFIRCDELERLHDALAASQAECARLREKLADVQETLEDSDMLPFTAASIGSVLASAPGSTDALREVCERAWRAGSLHGMGGCNPTDGPPWTEADDKRMAAEVANILGERGKEGGDA